MKAKLAPSLSSSSNHRQLGPQKTQGECKPRTIFSLCNTSDEPLIAGFALLRLAQLINFDVHYIGGTGSETNNPQDSKDVESADDKKKQPITSSQTVLDDLANSSSLWRYLAKFGALRMIVRVVKISLSLLAIILCFDKLFSIVILCLTTRLGSNLTPGNTDKIQSTTNQTVRSLVLFIINMSSLYILFSTVFNGHLLWNLFSQRIFLVRRKFQYKMMIVLLLFTYFEYLVNISFVNNLYEWDLNSDNIKSKSYSVLANLRILVTDSDADHQVVDLLLGVFQFARGIIRISPYITINYAILCLRAHIGAIRCQRLLVDSLKKRQRLRLVIMNRDRADLLAVGKRRVQVSGDQRLSGRKKKVSFVTSDMKTSPGPHIELPVGDAKQQTIAADEQEADDLLGRVRDFDQLEMYINNLYVFSNQLNRFMSCQGLGVFFIVHNLVISASLIVPDAIRGGAPMVQLIRTLVVLMGLVPFALGQALNGQLAELSRQIDRIIIQRQFVHRRRDNLIRIRELIHDIKVNCGSMLNFNIETGIKYLVVAFATAFFIEQERK